MDEQTEAALSLVGQGKHITIEGQQFLADRIAELECDLTQEGMRAGSIEASCDKKDERIALLVRKIAILGAACRTALNSIGEPLQHQSTQTSMRLLHAAIKESEDTYSE